MQGGCVLPEVKLGVVEARFADIIWKNEPLHSRELNKTGKQVWSIYSLVLEDSVPAQNA